jgi:signal transduction histidine kinase
VIGELRGYILRHEAEDGPQGDLGGVLTSLVDRLRSTTESELRTEISADAARRLSGVQAVHLANLAREALSNSMRHAQARRIIVALWMEHNRVALEISDDGRGFDPVLAPQGGFGLTSMRRRAAEAGGELDLNSRPGHGCWIRVTVPTSAEEGPQD